MAHDAAPSAWFQPPNLFIVIASEVPAIHGLAASACHIAGPDDIERLIDPASVGCPKTALALPYPCPRHRNAPPVVAIGIWRCHDDEVIAELNGKPIEPGELAGLALYNYGHFTSLVAYDSKAKGLELHLDRLVHDCQELHGSELDRDEVRRLIAQAAARIDGASVIRLTVFDPSLNLSHPGEDLNPQILITTRPAPTASPMPVRLTTTEYVRDLPEVKHVGLFATVSMRRQAQLDGFDDVAFLDATRQLSEGATWNLGFITDDGTIVLPDQPCLPGVTIRLLTDALDREGIEWKRETLVIDGTFRAAAGFITNAAVGVRPIAEFASLVLDTDHPRISELRKLYRDIEPERI